MKAKDAVQGIVDSSILVRLGNLFYWQALSSEQTLDYEKALEFYIRANQLIENPVLWLTIGFIYLKLDRGGEAKKWIKEGFSLMRKKHGDVGGSCFPFPYIYYFPYPKGPPATGAEAIPILKICPSCLKKCDIDHKSCPVCGYRF
ncbi:MAG: hypothetical protein ACFFDI_32070 [Promethearchaeota archaeon]